MKNLKLVMLTLLTAFFMVSCVNKTKGQTGVQLYATTSVNGTIDSMLTRTFDTVTNTNTKYWVSKTGQFSSTDNAAYTLSFTAQSVSGTPATVRFVWEGSFNGYNWFRMTNCYGTDGLNCDTLTITPSTTATQYKFVSRPGAAKLVAAYASTPVYNQGCRVFFQRLRAISTGTQATRFSSPSIFSSK